MSAIDLLSYWPDLLLGCAVGALASWMLAKGLLILMELRLIEDGALGANEIAIRRRKNIIATALLMGQFLVLALGLFLAGRWGLSILVFGMGLFLGLVGTSTALAFVHGDRAD